MNRLAIFDCDGTLVDSGAPIVAAIGETFASHGLPIPDSRTARRAVGLSLHEAMARLAPDASDQQHRAMAETYRAAFSRARLAGRVEEPLYPGIVELLDALESDGWLLAVATGKSDRGLRHCLEVNGVFARFVSLQTANRHPSKPHPAMALAAMAEAGAAPATSFVVGDTGYDMAMARAAGMAAMGVGWGYHEPHELMASGAGAVADTPAEVALMARAMMGVGHG